ncbi:MAG: hypothetical protein AB1646_22925 [Thermodesulfobacteriota bacterium]
MPFERLLFTSCLLPGKTDFVENKAKVEIRPEPGETILFFCIDDQSKGADGCELRKDLWNGRQGERICDLLVFYAKEDRRVLCFVELKDSGSDSGKATEQIINTYKAMESRLLLRNHYSIQAFLIGYQGSAPKEHRRYEDKLKKVFKDNFILNGRKDDFAPFLRGTHNAKSSRGRSKAGRKR